MLPDEIKGIYRDFTLDAIHRIREFQEHFEIMDRDLISKNAHYLKGAARSLGFVDMANRLGHIEHLHRTPTQSEWHRLMTQLNKSLDSSLVKLIERFPSLQSDALNPSRIE